MILALVHWIMHTCTLANVNAGLNNITRFTVQAISHIRQPLANSCTLLKLQASSSFGLHFFFPPCHLEQDDVAPYSNGHH